MDDREIIRLLKKNPSEGLYEAIQKYNRLVRSIVQRILPNNPEDVEECVEDTFVNIWQNIHRFEPDTPYFRPYLLSIARNLAISRYRQMKRSDVVSLESVPEPVEEDIAGMVLQAESSRELREAMLEMEEPDRGIFFRRFFLFESYKQIASALKLSEAQVKNRLHRKKLWLRRTLEERGFCYEANG